MVSSREKNMIGIGLIAAAGVIVFFLALPQFQQIQTGLNLQQSLDAEIQELNNRQVILSSEVSGLRAGATTPQMTTTATVRTVSEDQKQAAVKEILDNIIKQATGNGNKLIELKPDESMMNQQSNTDQVRQTALSKLATDPSLETFTDEEKRAIATLDPTNLTDEQRAGYDLAVQYANSNPLPYEARYEIAFRGTFTSLEGFLQSVQDLDDVIEFLNIKLVNEAGADRSGTEPAVDGEDVLFDPAKPIRLTASMIIYLDVR